MLSSSSFHLRLGQLLAAMKNALPLRLLAVAILMSVIGVSTPVAAAPDPALLAFERGIELNAAKKFAVAAVAFKRACDGGYSGACVNLGTLYENGAGVAEDLDRAYGLYQKGCDDDIYQGCHYAGLMRLDGRGVPKNAKWAADLFKQACFLGDFIDSCIAYALLSTRGEGGMPVNYKDAATGFSRACNLGLAPACSDLGQLYYNGEGVVKDLPLAFKLFEKACEGGNMDGCSSLGFLYGNGEGVAKDLPRALKLYEKACEGGSSIGCSNLGFQYEKGEAVEKDLPRAIKLYEKACEGGESLGCSNLGEKYAEGNPPNKAKAIEAYRRALELDPNNTPATEALAKLGG